MEESPPRPNVLLVDDVEANLVVLEALLGGMACNLVRAGSGNEALRQLLKREFAVILLDVTEQVRDREEGGLKQLLSNSRIVAGAVSHELAEALVHRLAAVAL